MVRIPQLVAALQNDTVERTTWMGVCEVIESCFKGDLGHVKDTLSLLWRTIDQDDDSLTPGGVSFVHLLFSRHPDVEVDSQQVNSPPLHAPTIP